MLGSNSNPPVFRSVSSNRRFVPVEQPQGCLSPLLTGVSPLGVVRESYNSNSIGTNVEVATTTNSGNNMNNATTNSNTTGNNTNSNVVPQVSVSISNTNKFNFTGLANKPRLRVQSPSPIWTNNNTRGILHGGIANIGVNNQGGGSSSSSSSTEGGTSSNADGSTGNNGEQTTQQRTNTSVPFSANSSSSSLTTAGGLTSMSGTVDNNNVNSNNAYTTPSNQQNASLPAPVSVGSTTTSFRQTNSTTTGNAGNTRSYQVTSPLAGPRFPNLPPPKLLGGAPGGSRARSPLVNFHSASNNTNNANSLLGGHSVVVGAGNSGNKNESTGNQSITTNPSPLAHGSFAPSQNTTRTVGHTTPSQHMSIPTAARSPPASCPWSSSGQQSAFGTINRGPSPMDRSKVATSQQKNDNTQQQTANTSATPLVRAPTPTCFNLLGGNNGSKQQQGQSTMSEGIQRSTLSCNFRTKDPNSTFLRGPSPPKSGPMGFVPYAGVLNAGPSPTQFARGLLGGHSGSKVPNSHLSSYNSGTNSITPCMISGGAGKSSSSSSSAAATTSSSMEFTKDPRRTNLVYGVANGKKKSSSDVSSNQVPPDTKTEPSVNIGGGQTHVQKSLMSRRGNYNYYGNGKPLDNVAEATAIEESNSRELSQPQRPLLRTSKSRSLSSSPQIQGNNTATSSTTAVPNENANKADTASKHGANSSNNNFLTSNTGVASGNLATNNRASDRLLQSTASQKTELQQGDDLLGSVCTNPHNHFSSTGGILSDRFLMTEDIEKTTGTNFGIADEHYANGLNAALAMEQANGILVPVDDDDQIQIGLDVADPRSGSINDNTIDSSSLNSTSLLKVSTEQTIDIVVTPIDHTTGSIEENTIYSMKSFSLDELQEMQERMDRDAAGALLQSARNSARNSARSSLAARNSNGNVNTKGGTTLNIVDAAGKHVKPGSSTTATATTTQKSLSKLASRSSGSNNSVTRKGSSSSSGPQGDLRTLRKDSNDLNAEESPLDINFVDDQTPAGGVNNIFSTEKSRVSTTSSNGRSNGSPLDTNGNSDTAASALAAASSSNSLPIHDKYSVAWGMVDNEADVAIKDVAEGAVKEAESNVKKIQKASSARPSGGEIGDFRIYEDAEDGNPGETNESVVDTASKIILQEVDTNINNLLPQARASHPKDSKRFRFVSDHSSNAFSSNASPVTRVGDSFQESENLENFAPYANTKGLAVKRAKSEMDMIYRHGTGKTSTNEKSHGTMMIHEGPNSLPPAIATSNSGPREVTAVAAEPIRVQKKDSNVSNTSHASTPTSCMSSGSSSCAARSPLELVDMQVVHVPNRAVQTTNPYLSKGNSGSSSAAPPSGGEEIVENKGEKEDSGKNTTKSVASAYTLTKNDDKEFSRNTRIQTVVLRAFCRVLQSQQELKQVNAFTQLRLNSIVEKVSREKNVRDLKFASMKLTTINLMEEDGAPASTPVDQGPDNDFEIQTQTSQLPHEVNTEEMGHSSSIGAGENKWLMQEKDENTAASTTDDQPTSGITAVSSCTTTPTEATIGVPKNTAARHKKRLNGFHPKAWGSNGSVSSILHKPGSKLGSRGHVNYSGTHGTNTKRSLRPNRIRGKHTSLMGGNSCKKESEEGAMSKTEGADTHTTTSPDPVATEAQALSFLMSQTDTNDNPLDRTCASFQNLQDLNLPQIIHLETTNNILVYNRGALQPHLLIVEKQ